MCIYTNMLYSFVLPLCSWVWSNAREYGQPTRGHIPNENGLSLPQCWWKLLVSFLAAQT